MIKMETKFFIKDVIINESGHLNTFLGGYNSHVCIFFNMYFLSLIQVFSLNVFYNVLEKMYKTNFCKNLICNWKIQFKGDDNTKKM
jgi:hypothetical protein